MDFNQATVQRGQQTWFFGDLVKIKIQIVHFQDFFCSDKKKKKKDYDALSVCYTQYEDRQ